ncbi:MAG: GlxA family transcriptional regulator [Methylococcaceae bacterium]|nr:GlxA family transcriptional regulator [Methylococcaceae bacterium]
MNTEFPVRPIGVVAFPGVEILDITGPAEVFTFANLYFQRRGFTRNIVYPITILADRAGPVATLSGLQIVAEQSYGRINGEFDTLLLPGGDVDKVLADPDLVMWLKATAPQVRRVVSVCTGAFLLAESGLLDGRNATTHWNYCREFSQAYPNVTVESDRIFVKDGNVFSSGGVTSGIDLALALVEEDWGREVALYVARYMVVFLKRPGGQSQFSSYLTTEASGRPDIRDLQVWIMQHPDGDLMVETLAERMAMSPRNFARLFLSETGMTPAKFVEMVRIDTARHKLTVTSLSVDIIADQSGFKDPERMRRAFLRQLGVNPSDYRQRFGETGLSNYVNALNPDIERSRHRKVSQN